MDEEVDDEDWDDDDWDDEDEDEDEDDSNVLPWMTRLRDCARDWATL
jgi:hypothetical protein